MKALHILSIGATMIALAACSNNSGKTEADTTATAEKAATETPAPTADGKVIEITDAATLAPGVKVDRLTVVDFNAVWCGPCRQLAPVLHDMAAEYAGKADFYSVDVDKFGQLMDDYKLGNSIPVVLFIHPDGTTEHYVGTSELLPADKFKALIEKNL